MASAAAAGGYRTNRPRIFPQAQARLKQGQAVESRESWRDGLELEDLDVNAAGEMGQRVHRRPIEPCRSQESFVERENLC